VVLVDVDVAVTATHEPHRPGHTCLITAPAIALLHASASPPTLPCFPHVKGSGWAHSACPAARGIKLNADAAARASASVRAAPTAMVACLGRSSVD